MKLTTAVIVFAAVADTIKCAKLITPQVDHEDDQSNNSLSNNDDVELSNNTREGQGLDLTIPATIAFSGLGLLDECLPEGNTNKCHLGIGLIVLALIVGIVIVVVCSCKCLGLISKSLEYGRVNEQAKPASQKASQVDWAAFFRDAGISSEKAETYTIKFALHDIKSDLFEELDEGLLQDMGITSIVDIRRITRTAKNEHVAKYTSDDVEVRSGESLEDNGAEAGSGKKNNIGAAARAAGEEPTEEQEEKLEEKPEAAQEDQKPAPALDSPDATMAAATGEKPTEEQEAAQGDQKPEIVLDSTI